MSLIYSLVSRGEVILAEHQTNSGNFQSITQSILSKIPSTNSKLTYVYDKYLFHYICEEGIIFLCMADESFGRRIPFAFLENIKQKFTSSYSPNAIEDAPAYGFNEFSKTLAQQMDTYSNDPNVDRFKQAKNEIEGVKDVMVQNIERVLERGERIDLLVDKTDNLTQSSFIFRKRSTALRRSLWWKNARLRFMVFVSLLVSN
ncbi:vesicle-associated membrane protein [Conidiobolus coronatus NRRL 28638]|uniref:Synaptobrevin homolog YKT6 n=1 Tax=Conidiobolus coronatus (strain ATCC 28846 / CBS 209.66 / NRRL 28638) TaxID=796925 RepID=A0A137NQQ8_CONC2|nr:vesicle-associated membrane protein [Conidiobolus coronatus NRRL 28638]|eukprot:KXN65010.1 vesicle-associated membrane protein [Conidiobolus coronatus NRRL 28638]